MRQLLMLGFYCEVYRREPTCRIYINDILLDEFDIPHAPHKDDANHLFFSGDGLNPNFFDIEYTRVKLYTPFLKYIEFDDQDAKEIDIKIEIYNNDNNYANGFMTKNTQMMLPFMFLASKNLLDRIDNLKNNWKFSIKNYQIQNKRAIDIFYSKTRNRIFENFAEGLMSKFPDKIYQQVPAEEIRPYCSNWQDLPPRWKDINGDWVGSSGYFHLKLKKKLGFWRLDTDLRKGRHRLGFIAIVEHLYNKYR